LAAARSLARAGRPDEALAVIDRGVAACGAVTSLVVAGVELADPDAALRRLDALPETAANLALRAQVLDRAGRADAARQARLDALRLARAARPSPARDALIRSLTEAP